MNDGIDVEELAIAANKFFDEAQSAASGALEAAWKSGQALIGIKATLKHGQWKPWITDNFHGSYDTAAKYMQLASNVEHATDLVGYTSIREVLNAIRAEKTQGRGTSPPAPKSNKKHPRHDEVIALSDQGKTDREIAAITGMVNAKGEPQRQIRHILDREAIERDILETATPVDINTLPGKDKDKVEHAKRVEIKKLQKQYDTRLAEAIVQRQTELAAEVAAYKEQLAAQHSALMKSKNEDWDTYKKVIAANRAQGVITPREYKVLVRCLHSDTRMSLSAELLDEAARIINNPIVKIRLVKDTDNE